MKDTIGQEITLGDMVLWMRFDRSTTIIYEVVKITTKRIHILEVGLSEGSYFCNSMVEPDKVVVITSNLEQLVEEADVS